MSTVPGVIIWYAGKYLFKYFILSLGKYTAFFVGLRGLYRLSPLGLFLGLYLCTLCGTIIHTFRH